MNQIPEEYIPENFQEMSAWLGSAGAPASLALELEAFHPESGPATVEVVVTRELLKCWAKLAFGLETLGLRYGESRHHTGLRQAGGVLFLRRDEEDGTLALGWESDRGARVSAIPADALLGSMAAACRSGEHDGRHSESTVAAPLASGLTDHQRGD